MERTVRRTVAGDPQAGAPDAVHVNAGWRMPFTNLLCKQPSYGGIRAIDLAGGGGISCAQDEIRLHYGAGALDRCIAHPKPAG